jgi:Flp pilus assembly protein CpaB
LRAASKRFGNQIVRIVLLVALIALSGMAVGYAVGYPLRYVDYEASSAVQLDQAALAGTIEVAQALVSQADLPAGWAPGDSKLGSFGVLGADVCGTAIETPTPLSAKEAAVFTKPGDGTTVIAQALRVDKWKSAEEYVDDVSDELEECETFFRVDGDRRVKVTSRPIEHPAPVTDHVARIYQSADGVQVWSMMAVGDVIIAVQYLGPTPPPESFLPEVERAVLTRIDPGDFAAAGVQTAVEADADATPETTTTVASDAGGAADESGQ